MHFLIVPCENVYNKILGRSFMANLYVAGYMVHLKMKYHNNSGKLVIIKDNIHGARLIHEAILKNLLATIVSSKKRKKKAYEAINLVELNACKEEVLQDDKLSTSTEENMKTLRANLTIKFEVVFSMIIQHNQFK